MDFPFGETVVLHVRTVTGQDGDGNDVRGNTSTTVHNVPVWSRDGNASGGNEQLQGQNVLITGLAMLLPPGTSLAAVDSVTARGEDYEVAGDPGVYRSPFTGTDPGVFVNLTRITG